MAKRAQVALLYGVLGISGAARDITRYGVESVEVGQRSLSKTSCLVRLVAIDQHRPLPFCLLDRDGLVAPTVSHRAIAPHQGRLCVPSPVRKSLREAGTPANATFEFCFTKCQIEDAADLFPLFPRWLSLF